MEVTVSKHLRKGKNKVYSVRRHYRKGSTHKTVNGKKFVYVDGFWKHDDYPNAPKPGWSYEHLVKERSKLLNDLQDGLENRDILPPRKYGLLSRRIRKINRILKHKER